MQLLTEIALGNRKGRNAFEECVLRDVEDMYALHMMGTLTNRELTLEMHMYRSARSILLF